MKKASQNNGLQPKEKKRTPGLVQGLLGLLTGVCLGVSLFPLLNRLLRPEMGLWESELMWLGLIVLLFVCYQAQIAIHETGHLLFGLATGYRFLMWRFHGLAIARREGGLRLAWMPVAGTGGQCILKPPAWQPEGIPYRLYHMGGFLLNAITAGLAIALAATLGQTRDWLYAVCYLLAVSGLFSAVINALPVRLTYMFNDGRNLLEMHRSLPAQYTCWLELTVAASLAEGRRLGELPPAWFELPGDDPSPLVSHQYSLRIAWLLDQSRWQEALSLVRELMDSGRALMGFDENMLNCQEMALSLLTGQEPASAALWDAPENRKRRQAMRTSPGVLSATYVCALLRDADSESASRAHQAFEAMARRYPYPQDLSADRAMMALADQLAAAGKEPECASSD